MLKVYKQQYQKNVKQMEALIFTLVAQTVVWFQKIWNY